MRPAVIVVLGALIGFANPVFFDGQNLLNILQAIAVVGMAAIGATFVVISGNLDNFSSDFMNIVERFLVSEKSSSKSATTQSSCCW